MAPELLAPFFLFPRKKPPPELWSHSSGGGFWESIHRGLGKALVQTLLEAGAQNISVGTRHLRETSDSISSHYSSTFGGWPTIGIAAHHADGVALRPALFVSPAHPACNR